MHKPEVYASEANWVNSKHWPWLQEDHGNGLFGRKRIWMIDRDERVPNSVRFPIEQVMALIPFPYMRSSPALALGLAIVMGYKHIALYGSELSSNTEYRYQAINYAFWIGYALGHGVDIDLQCWHSEFYEQPIYGYGGETQIERDYFRRRAEDHKVVWNLREKAYDKVRDKLNQHIFNNEYDKAGEMSLNLEEVALSWGESYGMMSEALRYSERENEISRQEFERVTAQAIMDGEKAQKNVAHAGGKCEYVWNVWMQTRGNLEARNQFRQFVKEKADLAFECGKLLGKHRENGHYMDEYDKRVTALGGQRAVYQVEGGGNGKG
jgi:hypothetical protein